MNLTNEDILKIYFGKLIVESDFSKNQKLYILDVIQHELSYIDMISILKYGNEFTYLTESQKRSLKPKSLLYESVMLNEVSSHGVKVGLKKFISHLSYIGLPAGAWWAAGLYGTIAGFLTWLSYRLGKSLFDKCSVECGRFSINTVVRQYCILFCKYKQLLEKKFVYEKALGSCKVADDPEQCRKDIKAKLEYLQRKIDKKKKDIETHQQIIRKKGYDKNEEFTLTFLGI